MEKITPALGWIGFVFGLLTAFTSLLGLMIGIVFMAPGFLFSSLYILLSTKYNIIPKGINPGYFGLLLNSVPLIILLYYKIIK